MVILTLKPSFETCIFESVVGERKRRGRGRAQPVLTGPLDSEELTVPIVQSQKDSWVFLFKYIPRFSICLCHLHPALVERLHCRTTRFQRPNKGHSNSIAWMMTATLKLIATNKGTKTTQGQAWFSNTAEQQKCIIRLRFNYIGYRWIYFCFY